MVAWKSGVRLSTDTQRHPRNEELVTDGMVRRAIPAENCHSALPDMTSRQMVALVASQGTTSHRCVRSQLEVRSGLHRVQAHLDTASLILGLDIAMVLLVGQDTSMRLGRSTLRRTRDSSNLPLRTRDWPVKRYSCSPAGTVTKGTMMTKAGTTTSLTDMGMMSPDTAKRLDMMRSRYGKETTDVILASAT